MSGVRITPEERQAAERRLQDAVEHGVLDLDEFNERIGVVLQAKTNDDLLPVLADLPRLPDDQPRMVTAFLGDETVDLRDVLSRRPVAEVTVTATLATVKILVPPGTRVESTGFAPMGSRKIKVTPTPDGPLLRLETKTMLTTVIVQTAERHPTLRAEGAKRVLGGALAAAAAVGAIVLGGTALGNADLDAVSVFGSREYYVQPGENEVRTLSLFGSSEVVVPDGTRVQQGGLSLFGSTECGACELPADPAGEVVVVHTYSMFGSTEISTPQSQRLEDDD